MASSCDALPILPSRLHKNQGIYAFHAVSHAIDMESIEFL